MLGGAGAPRNGPRRARAAGRASPGHADARPSHRAPRAGRASAGGLRLYLEFIHTENRERNRVLRRQLGEAVASLNGIGIEPVLLKGAVRLVDRLYPSPAWRFMRDLDLLVPRDRLSDAAARLATIGYGFGRARRRLFGAHRHLPPLGRDHDAAVIEIHEELLPSRRDLCPAAGVLARSLPVDVDGARARLPDTIDQIALLIGHDRFDGNLHRSGSFLLRSIFETALLCSEEQRVRELLDRFTAAGAARWVWMQLELVRCLFPGYVTGSQNVDLAARLAARAFLALERFDGNDRLRQFFRNAGHGMLELQRSRAAPGSSAGPTCL